MPQHGSSSQYVSRGVKYKQKVFPIFDSIFHTYLTRGLQIYARKFNSHNGFLRADQGRAKNCCQIGWIGCPILQVAQKATMRFQISFIFKQSPHQVDMKNFVKWWKDFLLYFTTLETYRVLCCCQSNRTVLF